MAPPSSRRCCFQHRPVIVSIWQIWQWDRDGELCHRNWHWNTSFWRPKNNVHRSPTPMCRAPAERTSLCKQQVLFDAEKGMEVLEQHLLNRFWTSEVHALRVEAIPLGHKAVPSRPQARGPNVTAILVVDACEQRHPLPHVASGFDIYHCIVLARLQWNLSVLVRQCSLVWS